MAEPNQADKEAEGTMNNTVLSSKSMKISEILTKDEKALKKKLKKERQKEKRNSDKPKVEATNNVDISIEKKVLEEKPDDENTLSNENYDAEDISIDFSIQVPAFVRSSVVSKTDTAKMLKKINDNVKDRDPVNETHQVLNKVFSDESNGFTCVKKGTKQASVMFPKTPEGFGIQALNVIRVGNFPLAIEYLTRAIALDPIDTRHYINRSYCHLRTKNYEQALVDIRHASKHLGDITEVARAKCREGQALAGLREYEAAEQAFRHCIDLAPNCVYAKRELIRVQIAHMVEMGFNERDAILALKKKSNTMEAIILLSNEESTNRDAEDNTGSATDDEIFNSDDEENLSNERMLSKILNYDPSEPEEPCIPQPIPLNKMINNVKQAPRAMSADRELRILRTIDLSTKPKTPSQSVNEMAIWIGNVTVQIPDSLLMKRFGKFGKVSSVWRSPSASYCFVNFQTLGAAKKALEEANFNGGNIDVEGNLLPIKFATTKTFK